jgi:drug/metabolite transporter (DMT)-like permease
VKNPLSGLLLTAALTGISLVAFAANSVLCRLALGAGSIDPASFTSVRLVAGALVLWALAAWRGVRITAVAPRPWWPALMLFVYAIGFSYAYVSLTAGTGALILFGAVQLTMIGAGMVRGERLGLVAWCGLVLALGGLLYLVSPGLAAPAPLGAVLMASAGVAWGTYSLLGRGAADPAAATAANFVRAVPFALLVSLVTILNLHLSVSGLALAITSGAITSGLGYVIWYSVLPRLTRARAGIAQLAVPPIAAVGGALLLSEPIGLRLLTCTIAILGGVAAAVFSKNTP